MAFLVDQNVQEEDGIFVEFFGRPAATTTVAAALAVKTGCALLPAHCEALPDGRYRFAYGRPLEWTTTGNRQADIARLTQELTTEIESCAHGPSSGRCRRWKRSPAGGRVDHGGDDGTASQADERPGGSWCARRTDWRRRALLAALRDLRRNFLRAPRGARAGWSTSIAPWPRSTQWIRAERGRMRRCGAR